MDISKEIATFLRNQYGLGASHAREIAASFLGFKSHAAFLASHCDPARSLKSARFLLPDLERIEARIEAVAAASQLPDERALATEITALLKSLNAFNGTLWLARTEEEFEYIMETEFLRTHVSLDDELSHLMALTNAWFDEDYYDKVKASAHQDGILVEASGWCTGETREDRVNVGERIDFKLDIVFKREKLPIAFSGPEITANGEVLSPYAD